MPRTTDDPKLVIVTTRLTRTDGDIFNAVRRKLGGKKSDVLRFALAAAARELKVSPTTKPPTKQAA